MQNVYTDFGFGTYPGTSEFLFQSLGMTVDPHYAFAEATKDNGPLSQAAIPNAYRVLITDSEQVRRKKAYSWMIDQQIARIMPNAWPKPIANNPNSYDYWSKYLDYVVYQWGVGIDPPPDEGDGGGDGGDSGGGGGGGGGGDPDPPGPPGGFLNPNLIPHYFDFAYATRRDAPRDWGQVASTMHFTGLALDLGEATLGGGPPGFGVPRLGVSDATYNPVDQDWRKLWHYNNPNYSTFPSANWGDVDAWFNRIGYVTYTQFMMDLGRDRTPLADDWENAAPRPWAMTPLSTRSPHCPMHSESTAGGTFRFPPREQPMHAVRRALIAALQEVKTRNAGLSPGTGDKVCLITYDGVDQYHAPTIVEPLTDKFDKVMKACTTLQSVSDVGNTTATEPGLIKARAHIAKLVDGGMGRNYTTKVIVLCTDGVPNVWQSTAGEVNGHIGANPNPNYYGSQYVWYNSVLRQAALMAKKKEKLYGVGMGLGADIDFMDRVARIAKTDEAGLSPRGTGNPTDYEQQLINIFRKIINTRSGRLVR